jgi:hypothetical protein
MHQNRWFSDSNQFGIIAKKAREKPMRDVTPTDHIPAALDKAKPISRRVQTAIESPVARRTKKRSPTEATSIYSSWFCQLLKWTLLQYHQASLGSQPRSLPYFVQSE